jgi:GntR family transcriptional regulator
MTYHLDKSNLHTVVWVVTVPLKTFEAPKYARIVNTLQERITDGSYAPGDMLPSEAQLIAEFGASRPVVVRALGILQQDGWIASEHGRGRFVRRTQPSQARQGAGRDVFRPETGTGVGILDVQTLPAPARAASALSLDRDAMVVARRRLVTTSVGPVQLATLYVPAELAEGTDLTRSKPLRTNVLSLLTSARGIEWEYATDRITARPATAEESSRLELGRREPVLSVLVTAFDTVGAPRVAVDATIATSRLELEDTFPLS